MFEADFQGLVDTGAGESYIIANTQYLQGIPLEPLATEWRVAMADNSMVQAQNVFKGYLTIRPIDEFQSPTTKIVQIYIIPAKSKKPMLIIGRNIIELFNISIHGIKTATMNNSLIYDAMSSNVSEDKHLDDLLSYVSGPIPTEILQLFTHDNNEDDLEIVFSTSQSSLEQHSKNGKTRGELDVHFIDNRAFVNIPWRTEMRPQPNVHATATRDRKVVRMLNPDEKELYLAAVQDLMDGGFAEEIPVEERGEGHYIAIRPVFRRDRASTKCRLCLDATMLNKYTFDGGAIGKPLLDVLSMFRCSEFAGTFDITKAFWMVRFHEPDYKWFSTIVNGRHLRFKSLIFGGNFSPATLELAFQKLHRTLQSQLSTDAELWHNYVDDFLINGPSQEEVTHNMELVRKHLSAHGFQSDKVRVTGIPSGDPKTYLGYVWQTETDQICCKKYTQEPTLPHTPMNRTDLVSRVAKFYDTLGTHMRLTVAGRTLVRDAFAEPHEKDQSNPWKFTVSTDLQQRLSQWEKAVAEITESQTMIPRHVNFDLMYVFCDASTTAWCVKIVDKQHRHIFSRAGLVPNGHSTPKAELTALMEAVVTVNQLPLQSLKTTNIIILTDNEPNVHRLRNANNDKNLKQFEFNRVTKIRQMMFQLQDKYKIAAMIRTIPGKANLADPATRPWPLETPAVPDESILLPALENPDPYRFEASGDNPIEDTLLYMELRSAKASPRTTDPTTPATLPTTTIRDSQTNAGDRIRANDVNEQGLRTTSNGKIVIDPADVDLVQGLLKTAHGEHHYGCNATRKILGQTYRWKGMSRDITQYIKKCDSCSVTRIQRTLRISVGDSSRWLQSVEELGVAAIVGADVCEMQECEGMIGFITLTCAVTKWIRTVAIPSQTTEDLALALENTFQQSIFPKFLITDGFPSFKSKMFQCFCIKWNIKLLIAPPRASAYHGWFERPHKMVLDQLRVTTIDKPTKNWVELLVLCTHLVNSRPYEADDETALCPLHLVYFSSSSNITEDTENILTSCGLDHMVLDTPDRYKKLGEKYRRRHARLVQRYIQMFKNKRVAIQERLRKELNKNKLNPFNIGSYVRIYRPKSSKIASRVSAPCLIVAAPSASTRTIQKENGSTVNEYLVNLIPVTDRP